MREVVLLPGVCLVEGERVTLELNFFFVLSATTSVLSQEYNRESVCPSR